MRTKKPRKPTRRKKSIIELCACAKPPKVNPFEAQILNVLLSQDKPLRATMDVIGALSSALAEFAYDDTTIDQCHALLVAHKMLDAANGKIRSAIL